MRYNGIMLSIDDNLLQDLGLASLSADDKNEMLAQIYETLEMRVGMTLARQMTDEQLKQFEGFVDRNDEEGALKWLETNFPTYKDVVHSELEKLKGEIKQNASQILIEMQQAKQAVQDQAAAGVVPGGQQPAPHPTEPPASEYHHQPHIEEQQQPDQPS